MNVLGDVALLLLIVAGVMAAALAAFIVALFLVLLVRAEWQEHRYNKWRKNVTFARRRKSDPDTSAGKNRHVTKPPRRGQSARQRNQQIARMYDKQKKA